MTTETMATRTSYDEWRTRRWRLAALAVALLWLVTAVAAVVVGEKRSDLDQLLAAVSEGSVTHVEVVGLPADPTWRGRTQVTLTWHGSVLSRFAEVVVDTRRNPGTSGEGDRITGDPATFLRSHAPRPDLDVTYADHSAYQEWRDWRGPGWAAVLGLTAWLGTVFMAGSGPEPWRATRWAWTWLTLFGGPLGAAAYAVLGGPLGVWRPRDLGRRLTGGWGFLLALVLFGGAGAG